MDVLTVGNKSLLQKFLYRTRAAAGELSFFLQLFGAVFVVVQSVSWSSDRTRGEIRDSWNLITGAAGKKGDAGRIAAVQRLVELSVNLAYADLSNAMLDSSFLVGAKLSEANLDSSRLRGSNMERAILENATLRGADMIGARLRNTQASYSNLSASQLTRVDMSCSHMEYLEMQKASINYANLDSAVMSWGHLSGASFVNSSLVGAILENTDLTNAELDDAILHFADLRRADLSRIKSMRRTRLIGADLRYVFAPTLTNLSKADVRYANIFGIRGASDSAVVWALGHGAVSIESDSVWALSRLKIPQRLLQDRRTLRSVSRLPCQNRPRFTNTFTH